MNGAECCVKHIQFLPNNQTFPHIIWVQFKDDRVGHKHKEKQRYAYTENINHSWIPILAISRDFNIKDIWIQRIQFPLRQSAARTIHASQSATYNKIYIDMSTPKKCPKNWWQHMHYVALSRVMSLEGLYIKDLNLSNICTSAVIDNYLTEAKETAKLILSYTPLAIPTNNTLNVVYHNARSYKKHLEDVKHDYNIRRGDIISISETRLGQFQSILPYMLENYATYRLDDTRQSRPCHGMITYIHKDISVVEE